jgi:hypothetical protein
MTETKFENVYQLLNYLQVNLNAPKNQRNNFGNYNYRNVEDIMEAIKPLVKPLKEQGAYVFVSDEMIQLGDRFYIKATATVGLNDKVIQNTAYARESLDKKGMDSSQITGSTSSYARKYALGGLLLVDDNKDADSDEKPQKTKETIVEKTLEKAFESPRKGIERPEQEQMYNTGLNLLQACATLEALKKVWDKNYKNWKEVLDEDLFTDIEAKKNECKTDITRENNQRNGDLV